MDVLKISRMTLNFRIDKNDKVYLLYSNFIQMEELPLKRKINAFLNDLFVETNVKMKAPENLDLSKNFLKRTNLKKEVKCSVCSQNKGIYHIKIVKNESYDINLLAIIESHRNSIYSELNKKTNEDKYVFHI